MQDNLQLSGVGVDDGRRVSDVPLNYSIPGHASATSAHAAAHKAHISHKKLSGIYGLKCRRC